MFSSLMFYCFLSLHLFIRTKRPAWQYKLNAIVYTPASRLGKENLCPSAASSSSYRRMESGSSFGFVVYEEWGGFNECRSITGMIWKLQHGISISQGILLKKYAQRN
jgi:hypothetical protein